MHHDCSIYKKCFNFLLNSCFFGKVVLLRKLKLIYPSTPQHYSNCSALTFLNFAKYAMTMHSIWERLQSYYHSIWQIFYLSHNVWRKLKNHMKIDIPNIASHFIFLTQIYYNLNFITSSSNFIPRFSWHFEINLRWLLLKDYCLKHTKNAYFWICLQNLY